MSNHNPDRGKTLDQLAGEKVERRNRRKRDYGTAQTLAAEQAEALNVIAGFQRFIVTRDADVELCDGGAYVAAYMYIAEK
jgi:hypothetical protein